MRRSSLFGFILLNVIVTFVTVFGVFSVLQRVSPQPTERPIPPPLVVVVTATQDPKGTQVTYIDVTVTPGAGVTTPDGGPTNSDSGTAQGTAVITTAGTTSSGSTGNSGIGSVPTLDPALLPPSLGTAEAGGDGSAGGNGTASANSAGGCQTYAIQKGDTAGGIATTFGISLQDLMRANKLKEGDLVRLQIGQVLTIPVGGCGIATEESTPTATSTKFVVPTPFLTATLLPTAAKAQVQVTQVINPGDITSEGVEILNISGGVIHMKGWTLSNSNGLTFTFPDYQMFPRGRVTVYTKKGTNTPVVLYWGQSRAAWGEPGQQVSITDTDNMVQASFNVAGRTSVSTADASGARVPTPTPGS